MTKSDRKKAQEQAQRARDKSEHWLIIYNPWHGRHQHRSPMLSNGDVQDIAWWLCICLRCAWGKVESIQHQTNKSFVIAKVDLSVAIAPALGQYNWSDFLKSPRGYERGQSTKVFEYDYVKFGDQSEKQWKETYPRPVIHPIDFPVVSEPPSPTWCEPPSKDCSWSIPLKKPPPNPRPKEEPGPMFNRPFLDENTQLLRIANPFGVRWTAGELLPDVSGIWDWLQLIANGAKALYVNTSGEREVIAALESTLELQGVLGRHIWQRMLVDSTMLWDVHGVSVITRCSENDIHGLVRIDAPNESEEDYSIFANPYPPPDPFMHENERDLKVVKTEMKTEAQGDSDFKRRAREDSRDYAREPPEERGSRKRVKLEPY
ncbi:hypothetical protein K439DRAFT_1635077 [Ramaria rubella]|nr:hypothetical protein K439DRAFT_1635077 [Ramaria rubella]